MPRFAIGVVVVWFLSLFVFRSVLQWWQTGSTGMKGFSGPVGSLEWNAGALTSIGMALACVSPFAALYGWPAGSLWAESAPVHGAGALFAAAGVVGALAAQVTMGDSWRIGVDEAETTELVTRGLYRWVRNPIFSFILLSGVGLVLLVFNTYAVTAFVLTVIGIEIQVRVVEEPYLRRVHGSSYRDYCAGVGRFVPGLR